MCSTVLGKCVYDYCIYCKMCLQNANCKFNFIPVHINNEFTLCKHPSNWNVIYDEDSELSLDEIISTDHNYHNVTHFL